MRPESGNMFGKIRRIGIAAPASSCDEEKLQAGIALLKQNGLSVVSGKHLFRKGAFSYLSADDPFRADDLNALIADYSVDAILCSRGGYGTPRILERIDYQTLRERNLPIIGFSDITALHLAMLSRNAGICVASQMAARLPEAVNDPETCAGMRRVYRLLSGKEAPEKNGYPLVSYKGNRSASGGIVPLNLTLAASLCGTEFLPSMDGRIVVLEEIGEPVRKIDRMLWQLRASGFFRGASGVILGQFSDCGAAQERELLFADFAGQVECPVFSGLPYGHDLPSLSFLFGEPCRVIDGIFY
ncbi:MAG: LD-carboxypeptidase [Lentisphaeria bacterium]|nr:LD-carboxypeptidase [Lentisphaeria bacterium]